MDTALEQHADGNGGDAFDGRHEGLPAGTKANLGRQA
jgi:hypothetical protein